MQIILNGFELTKKESSTKLQSESVPSSSSSSKKDKDRHSKEEGHSKDKKEEKTSKKLVKYLMVRCENTADVKGWIQAINDAIAVASPISSPSEETSSGATTSAPSAAAAVKQGLVFGAPLESAVKASGKNIPDVVDQCIRYIEARALEVVGIFRLSGSAAQIEAYKNSFDSGEKVDLSKESDPHAVSGLLKLYFRMLPEPILTFQLYQQFIIAQGVPNKNLRIRLVRQLVNELPKTNYHLLKVSCYICISFPLFILFTVFNGISFQSKTTL
jgi:hypothetical protein